MTAATLAQLVDEQASLPSGDDVLFSFVEEGEHWSPADLARRAARVSGQLRREGVGPGDHVGVLCADRRAFLDAFFGLQHRGAVPVPIGVAGRPGGEAWMAMLRRRCASLQLTALVTDPSLVGACETAASAVAVLTVDGGAGRPDPLGEPCDVAFIQPSSGTTGEPRGIVISHRAVLANLSAMRDVMDLGPWCSGVTWLPFFHDMGLIGTVLNPLYSGFHSNIWSHKLFILRPTQWLDLLSQTRSTIAMAPPFALETLTRAVRRSSGRSRFDLRCLRTLLVGSELIRPHVVDKFAEAFEAFGLRADAITPAYGLAEAVLGVTVTPLGNGPAHVTVRARPAIACGLPVPGTDLSLAADGELLVRSPSLMDGYLGDERGTARALEGGWLHTGDIAELTSRGVVILGRVKEMLNRNGVRMPPEDMEIVAASVEGVHRDRVVAVADTADDRERVVVLAESAAQGEERNQLVLAIRAELADAGVAADVVDLVPRGFFPRTTSGKLRRARSLEAYRANGNGGIAASAPAKAGRP